MYLAVKIYAPIAQLVDPPAGGHLSRWSGVQTYMFFVYAIYNKERNKIYIGQTKDMSSRLARHNKELPSKKSSYTSKQSGVWEIIYTEEFNTRLEALQREKQLKSYRGRIFVRSKIQS